MSIRRLSSSLAALAMLSGLTAVADTPNRVILADDLIPRPRQKSRPEPKPEHLVSSWGTDEHLRPRPGPGARCGLPLR